MPVKSWLKAHRKTNAAVQILALALNVASALLFALLYFHDHGYEACVKGYVEVAGRAAAPRAQTSAKATDELHTFLEDIEPLLFSGKRATPAQIERTKTDLDSYLDAYDEYAQAVKFNPTPPLPDCLGGKG